MVSMSHLKCLGPYASTEEIHFKINDKMMENQWKSTWVGASWAMLAQNDTFLKPCWLKMTERIDFSLIFRTILGYQNHTKISEKMKWFSDALKNCVFSAGRSQSLQNGVPKGIPNQAFSGITQNYRIVLPPARGASFQGLKASQTTFFPGPFS